MSLINQLKKNRQGINSIFLLAKLDMRRPYKASVLSWFWLVIGPAMAICQYLFAFATNGHEYQTISFDYQNQIGFVAYENTLNEAGQLQDFSGIGWLIIGAMIWTYLSTSITAGSNSVISYSWIILYLGKPVWYPGLIVTTSKSMVGFSTIAASWIVYMIVVAITNAGGGDVGQIISWNILELPIVLLMTFTFLLCYSLAISPFASFSKDIVNIIAILPVFLSWISGVFLPNESYSEPLGIIMRINPFNFILVSIRGSIMGCQHFFTDLISFGSFVGFTLILAGITYWTNKKSKSLVVDLI